MGTEGSRIRNRNRRIRKKNLKRPKQPFQFDWSKYVARSIFFYMVFTFCNIPYENILLYNNGIKTTAVVYANARLRHGVNCSHYQFYISGTRYKGRYADLEIGDSIEVIYLPKNPRVNFPAKGIESSSPVILYRKITGKTIANWDMPYMNDH